MKIGMGRRQCEYLGPHVGFQTVGPQEVRFVPPGVEVAACIAERSEDGELHKGGLMTQLFRAALVVFLVAPACTAGQPSSKLLISGSERFASVIVGPGGKIYVTIGGDPDKDGSASVAVRFASAGVGAGQPSRPRSPRQSSLPSLDLPP